MDVSDANDTQIDSTESQNLDRIDAGWEATEPTTEVYGNPEAMAEYHNPQTDDASCAIFAQESAMDAAGYGYDIEAAQQLGEQEGWFSPEDGTQRDSLGRVWEARGLNVEKSGDYPLDRMSESQTLEARQEAFNRLGQDVTDGKAVVVALETSPLPEWEGQQGGHALWVTGVEQRSDGPWIVCNDSGLPGEEGKSVKYHFEAFDKAWRQQGYQQVSTESPILRR